MPSLLLIYESNLSIHPLLVPRITFSDHANQGAKGNLPYLRPASGNSEKEGNDMSLVTGTACTGEAAAVVEAPLLDGRPVIIGTLAICTFYVGVRIYEQVFERRAQ
jgi:hypothetical protein